MKTLAMLDLDEMSPRVRWQVRFHLMICYFCRHYARQMSHLGTALRYLVHRESFAREVALSKRRIYKAIIHAKPL